MKGNDAKRRFGFSLFLIGMSLVTLFCRGDSQNFETNVFVETIAGSGFSGYLDGQGVQTMFSTPSVLAVDSQTNVFVWDELNRRIRKISAGFQVTTFAGSGGQSNQDGLGTNAAFSWISGMTVDGSDNILAANVAAIKRITPQGLVTTLAGSVTEGGYVDGALADARFGAGFDLATDHAGNIFVADTSNFRIRKVDKNGMVSTLAGSGNRGYQDGTGIFSSFYAPFHITVDPVGNVFVVDQQLVRRITQTGVVTTIAGCDCAGYRDGVGTNASFSQPLRGLASDDLGNLYLSDSYSVRKTSPDRIVTTVAGLLHAGFFDAEGAVALFALPGSLALDRAGRIYVADSDNQRIRRITHGAVPETGFNIGLYAGLSVVGPIGRSYRIEYATSLPATNGWSVATTVLLSTSPYLWIDPQLPTLPKRYYRAVQLP